MRREGVGSSGAGRWEGNGGGSGAGRWEGKGGGRGSMAAAPGEEDGGGASRERELRSPEGRGALAGAGRSCRLATGGGRLHVPYGHGEKHMMGAGVLCQ